jgi:hypothetical protein
VAHTYATVTELKNFLTDNGSSDLGTANDGRYLSLLEGVSRDVDGFCDRSSFGSGFGPRVGTNRYDGHAGNRVCLDDDLLALTSVTLLDTTAGTSLGTVAADTDYFLLDEHGHYEGPRFREFLLHQRGTITQTGYGYRVNSFTGTWGYSNETVTLTDLAAALVDTTGTSASLTAAPEIGMTLLIGSEQLYVTAVSGSATPYTVTVVRGVNGTTAATHLVNAAVSRYRYPREVHEATMQIAQRRSSSRNAGLTGDFGGGQMPTVGFRDTEKSIARATIGHLRIYGVR